MAEVDRPSEQFLLAAAEILLGAAYADGYMDGLEEDTIFALLEEATADDTELPDDFQEMIEEFDPEEFDLESVAEPLVDEPEEHRRVLYSMVATLRDEVEEDLFLVRLAEALDLETDLVEEFDAGLVFEADDDDDYLDDEADFPDVV